jgi:hypothetical protein
MQLIRLIAAAFVLSTALTQAGCGGGGGGGSTPAPLSPGVSIDAPVSGTTVTGTATVRVSASDNVGVTKVALYLDNGSLPIAEDTSAPYSFTLDTASLAKGSHTLVARAYGAAGNTGEASISFKVPIWISMDTVLTGSTATGTVTLHGLASAAALGLDLHVDGLPTGAAIDSLTATGGASGALAPTLDNVTGNIRLAGATAFGSGSVLIIHFSGVPASAVASDFRISLVDVVGQDSQGNVLFIPLN